jgi:hypothetical protein
MIFAGRIDYRDSNTDVCFFFSLLPRDLGHLFLSKEENSDLQDRKISVEQNPCQI